MVQGRYFPGDDGILTRKGQGSDPRNVLRNLKEVVLTNRVPYYFVVPTHQFITYYRNEQPVLATNGQEAGAGDRQLIEQWVFLFDKHAFLSSADAQQPSG